MTQVAKHLHNRQILADDMVAELAQRCPTETGQTLAHVIASSDCVWGLLWREVRPGRKTAPSDDTRAMLCDMLTAHGDQPVDLDADREADAMTLTDRVEAGVF